MSPREKTEEWHYGIDEWQTRQEKYPENLLDNIMSKASQI